MKFTGRRLALLLGAAGTATALVGAASFALFNSTALAQTDTFAAGTVILSGNSNGNCTTTGAALNNLEPGDTGSCSYTLTYNGTLNAWVQLNIGVQSDSIVPYVPAGSVTPIGGEALLDDSTEQIAACVTDSSGFLPSCTASTAQGGVQIAGVVSDCTTDSTEATVGTGPNNQGTGENCAWTQQVMLTNSGNPCGPAVTNCVANNNQPSGSWYPGLSDTISLYWNVPLNTPNLYQGSNATITLQGQAVQASNNPLISGAPCWHQNACVS